MDDHVVEPPNVWTDRLPSKYVEVGPRVVRAPVAEISFVGGKFAPRVGEKGEGPDADWWFYEDLRRPLLRLDAAVGYDRDEVHQFLSEVASEYRAVLTEVELQVEAPQVHKGDELQRAQTDQALSGIGKSPQTILMERGLDPDVEAATITAISKRITLAQRKRANPNSRMPS